MIETLSEPWLYYQEPQSEDKEDEEEAEKSLYQECSMKELLERLEQAYLKASVEKVTDSLSESTPQSNGEGEAKAAINPSAHSITFDSWVKPKKALYWKKLRFQPQLLLQMEWDALAKEGEAAKSYSQLSAKELVELFEQGKLEPLCPIKPSLTDDWAKCSYSDLIQAMQKEEESGFSALEACPPPLYQKILWNDMGFTVLAIFILVNFIALTGSPLFTQLSCLIVLFGLLIPSLQALAISQLGGTPAMHLAHLTLLTSNGKKLSFLTALQRQSLNLYSMAQLKRLPLELESEGASLWDKERSIIFRHEP